MSTGVFDKFLKLIPTVGRSFICVSNKCILYLFFIVLLHTNSHKYVNVKCVRLKFKIDLIFSKREGY